MNDFSICWLIPIQRKSITYYAVHTNKTGGGAAVVAAPLVFFTHAFISFTFVHAKKIRTKLKRNARETVSQSGKISIKNLI